MQKRKKCFFLMPEVVCLLKSHDVPVDFSKMLYVVINESPAKSLFNSVPKLNAFVFGKVRLP
jgi:hypothetical protein